MLGLAAPDEPSQIGGDLINDDQRRLVADHLRQPLCTRRDTLLVALRDEVVRSQSVGNLAPERVGADALLLVIDTVHGIEVAADNGGDAYGCCGEDGWIGKTLDAGDRSAMVRDVIEPDELVRLTAAEARV